MKKRSRRLLTLSEQDLKKLHNAMLDDRRAVELAVAQAKKSEEDYNAALRFAPAGFAPEKVKSPSRARPKAKKKIKTKPIGDTAKRKVKQIDLFPKAENSPTWTIEISRRIEQHPEGIAHSKLLGEILKSPPPELAISAGYKGFYHAIRRLLKRGDIVKHGTLLYTAKAMEAIRESGQELPVPDRRVGGTGAIVIETLGKHPTGLTGPQLQALASMEPGAPKSMRDHPHYIYNVLSSLISNGRVKKFRGMYKLAEPQGVTH